MPPKTRSKLDSVVQPLLWTGGVILVASLGWFIFLLLSRPDADPGFRMSWLRGCGVDLVALAAVGMMLWLRRKR